MQPQFLVLFLIWDLQVAFTAAEYIGNICRGYLSVGIWNVRTVYIGHIGSYKGLVLKFYSGKYRQAIQRRYFSTRILQNNNPRF